jgi:hypothetical protein
MGTTPPSPQEIDRWLADSGNIEHIIRDSYNPGDGGFHVRSFVVAYTTLGGTKQFFMLGTNDPTTHKPTARQLLGLIEDVGAITIRGYDYTEPIPRVAAPSMAAAQAEQQRLNTVANWMGS